MYNVTFPGGVAVDVALNGHTIHTDRARRRPLRREAGYCGDAGV
jgi:hypothetical protein